MDRRRRRFVRTVSTALIVLTAAVLPVTARMDAEPRFTPQGRVLDGAAEWVTSSHDRLVFGAGSVVTVATVQPDLQIQSVLTLDAPVADGWIAGSNLYLVRRTESADQLIVADLDAEHPVFRPSGFGPAASGSLKLTQMGDFLVVAESGSGLHFLELPSHRHPGSSHHHGHTTGLPTVAFLPFKEPILAVTATLGTVFLTTDDQLIEIDAGVPSAPVVVRRVSSLGRVHALSANDRTLRLLGDDGLRTIDLPRLGEPRVLSLDPNVQGRSLLSLGRSAYVAGGDVGLRRFHDTSPAGATMVVRVGDIFFNPAGPFNINVGDSVLWDKPLTALTHNVRSCIAGQPGCPGVATTSFFSGQVTMAAFRFTVPFPVAGTNPYVCQSHFIEMVGNVIVGGGGAAPPPGVPDGKLATTPMTVEKLSLGGANLRVFFDTACPNAVNHDLLFGLSGSLPAVLGGTYGPLGAACATGGSPFAWNGVPLPGAGDFLWWVIVADDGATVEGSWGKDINLGERNGAGVNGASGLCGNTDKDLTNLCGQ